MNALTDRRLTIKLKIPSQCQDPATGRGRQKRLAPDAPENFYSQIIKMVDETLELAKQRGLLQHYEVSDKVNGGRRVAGDKP